MQHLWIPPQILQTKDLRPALRPLDATLTKNRGWAYSPLNQKTGKASPRLYSLLPEGPLLEAAKSVLLILSALFPIVNPLGGSPVFFCFDPRIPRLRAQNPRPPRGHEQLRPVDCFVPDRLTHSAFFWNIHSGCSSGRRPHRHLQWLGYAQAQGRG